MSISGFVLALFVFSLSQSAIATDGDGFCRSEVFRKCTAEARSEFSAHAEAFTVACNERRMGGQEWLDCSPDQIFSRNYGINCAAEADRADCTSPTRPKTVAPDADFGRTTTVTSSATTPARAPSQPTARLQQQQSPSPSAPAAVAGPTPQDSGTAQSEASADVAQCNQLQSEAARCCGNPLACASPAQAQRANQIQQQVKSGPAPGQSIPNYCAQLGQLSSASGDYNADMASVCYAPQSSCSRTCQALAQKYYSRAGNCNDGTCSIFQGAADQLSSLAGNCDSLSSQVSRWSSQSISTASPQAGSSLCSNQNYNAQSAGGGHNQKTNPLNHQGQNAMGGANDPCVTNPGSQACAACTANPGSPQCQAAISKPEQQAGAGGSSGYASVQQETESGGFNPGNMQDMSDLNAGMNLATDAGGAATSGGGAQVVANNSGGGIPGGGGGGGGSSAKMDSGGKKAPAAPGGNVADIMQGNRSGGGYSQQAAKNSNDNQFGGGGYRASNSAKRGPASVGGPGGKGYLGMDLKKYLPGGEMRPYRGIAGLNASMEINGKSADLFKKISTKIEEKCRLGILWECR